MESTELIKELVNALKAVTTEDPKLCCGGSLEEYCIAHKAIQKAETFGSDRLDLSNPYHCVEALRFAEILRGNGYTTRAEEIEWMVAHKKGNISKNHPGFHWLDR